MSRWCILLIFVATLLGILPHVIIVYISVAVHECAHLLVCKAMDVPTKHMRMLPYGMELKLDHLVPPLVHMTICIAGPLANLALFCVGRFVMLFASHGYIVFFVGANFILLVFNLIPCIPMDGGEILRCVFSLRWGVLNSYRMISAVSYVLGSALFLFGMLFAYHTGGNITVLIVSLPVFVNISGMKVTYMYAVRDVMSGVVYHPCRIKVLTAESRERSGSFVRRISFGYSMVILVQMDGGEIHILTQKQLLDAVKQKNTFATLGECVEFFEELYYNRCI